MEDFPDKDNLIRNRRKLRKREVSQLEKEFALNNDWDKAFISKLAKEIGLPYYKVYKWNWDQKKKTIAGAKLGKRVRDESISMDSHKRQKTE